MNTIGTDPRGATLERRWGASPWGWALRGFIAILILYAFSRLLAGGLLPWNYILRTLPQFSLGEWNDAEVRSIMAIGLSGALSAMFIGILTGLGRPASEDWDISIGLGSTLLVSAVVVRLSVLSIMIREGFTTFQVDEVLRWDAAAAWADEPNLMPMLVELPWLNGGPIYFGMWMRLFNHPIVGYQVGLLVAHALSIVAPFYLTYVVSRRIFAGVACAWFIAVGLPYLWIGGGAMAEWIMAPAFLFALAFAWRFFELDGSRPRSQFRYALGAGVCAFVAASQHLVGWVLIVAALPVFGLALWLRRRSLGVSGWLSGGLILGGCALFPAYWMVLSWSQLGSPWATLHVQVDLSSSNRQNFLPASESMFWYYPEMLVREIAVLLPLMALGVILICLRRSATRLIVLGSLFTMLMLGMCFSAVMSGINLTPFRILIVPYTLAVIFALESVSRVGLPLISHHTRPLLRTFTVCALAFLAVGWFGFNVLVARRFERYHYERYDSDLAALATWLRHETRYWDEPEGLYSSARLGMYLTEDRSRGWYPAWLAPTHLRYLSGIGAELEVIVPRSSSYPWLAKYDYVISSTPLNLYPGIHAEKIRIGKYHVYDRPVRTEFLNSEDTRLRLEKQSDWNGVGATTQIAFDMDSDPEGPLRFEAQDTDPQLLIPEFDMSGALKLVIHLDMTVPSWAAGVEFFYTTHSAPEYSPRNSVRYPLHEGRNKVYLVIDAEGLTGRLRFRAGRIDGAYTIHRLEIRALSSDSAVPVM